MPQRITIPIVGGEGRSRAVSVNNQSTVNLINARKGRGAKAPIVLETVPGLVELGTAGDGPCRSPQMVTWTDGRMYGVFGTKLIAIDDTNIVTEIGTLDNANGIARIARGRTHIMVVDGDAGYTYDGTTFAKIADLDFPTNQTPAGNVTHVVYLDSLFIVNDASTDNFYISGVEDPDSWNALDFEAAGIAPDAALALAATESILYIPGDETTQLYYNSQNPDFPYENYLNAAQEVGIAAPQSIAESDSGVFFLATTPEGGLFVYRIQGTEGAIITEDEQEEFLGTEVTDPSTAYGFIYQQRGKAFYVLQLDNGQHTLVFNIKAGTWEQRQLLDGSGWRASGHGIQNFRNLVGSRIAARIYELDLEVYTDAGEDLVRRRVTQIYHNNNQLMEWWEVVIDVDSGVANANPPGDDPQISLRYSDDNGETWSSQLLQPLGKIGERQRRAVYRSLGDSRQRMFEIEFSDPVNFTLIAAYAYVTVLDD